MPGSNAPPMHPRCRSTICAVTEGGTRAAKAKGKNIRVPAEMSYDKWRESLEMYRRKANQGAFSELKIPMKKLAVVQICREYGVDISGLKIKIQREESLLKYGYAGSAAPEDIGRIDLFPNAFADEEQLLRTVIHEGCHVRQFKKYGGSYVQEKRRKMEEVAERYENFYFKLKRRLKNGKVF